MRDLNILITCTGRRAPLIKFFKDALNKLDNVKGKVITTNINKYSAGLYVSDKFYLVPSISDENYIPAIKDICQKENINIVIPTIDPELHLFAREKENFAKLGVTVLVSSEKTVEICNNKYETFNFFTCNNIQTPRTFLQSAVDSQQSAVSSQQLSNYQIAKLPNHYQPSAILPPLPYPLVLKPIYGRGSEWLAIVNNDEEFQFHIKRIPSPIIQEYIKGAEFTIDILSDFEGTPLCSVVRERVLIITGVSYHGKTVKNDYIANCCKNIASKLKTIGPINIQCILNENGIYFIEINPRFSGGIPLTIASGADFPLAILKLYLRIPVKPIEYKTNLTMLKYEESVFVEIR